MRGIFTTSPSIIVWKMFRNLVWYLNRLFVLILCDYVKSILSLDQSRHHPEHDGLLHEHRWTGFSCEGPRRRQASLDLGWWWWSLVRNDQRWWIDRCEFFFFKMLPFPPQVWSAWVWWVCHLERQVLVKRKKEQDPVSTMQKTGWTNHSAFQSRHSSSLVWFGPVWCGLTVGVDHLDAVTNHLLVYLAILV